MLNTINSDLIRGNITTIILKALSEGDRYGYDIVKEIEQRSSGQYTLKQPTLYSCLKRLEMQGFIRSYWGSRANGGRRKYYTLTDMGKDIFKKNRENWEYSRTVIDKLISDKEYSLTDDYSVDTVNDSNVDVLNDDMTDTFNTLITTEESIDSQDTEFEDEQIYDEIDQNDFEEFNNDEVAAANSILPSAEVDDQSSISDFIFNEYTQFENSDENIHEFTSQHTEAIQLPSSESLIESDSTIEAKELINKIFNSDSQASSYSQKIINEQYTASDRPRSYIPETYFNDFTDAYNESINNVYENNTSSVSDEPTQNQAATETNLSINTDSAPLSQSIEIANEEVPQQKNIAEKFLSYKNKNVSKVDEDKLLLEREYKNVLGRLVNLNIPISDSKTTSNPKLPFTDEMKQNIAKVTKNTTSDYPTTASIKEQTLSMTLDKVAQQTKQLTGDNIRNRIYDGHTDTQFRTTYHYYSNKIMLLEFFIVFAFMLVATVATFAIERLVLKVTHPHNIYFYLFGILLAVAIPIYAAVSNFRDPHAVKTYSHNMRDKLIFRLWVMACCLIITYCINVIIGMPRTLELSFLPTLLLPSLYSLMLPLDVAIFYLLYKSGNYNQK